MLLYLKTNLNIRNKVRCYGGLCHWQTMLPKALMHQFFLLLLKYLNIFEINNQKREFDNVQQLPLTALTQYCSFSKDQHVQAPQVLEQQTSIQFQKQNVKQ